MRTRSNILYYEHYDCLYSRVKRERYYEYKDILIDVAVIIEIDVNEIIKIIDFASLSFFNRFRKKVRTLLKLHESQNNASSKELSSNFYWAMEELRNLRRNPWHMGLTKKGMDVVMDGKPLTMGFKL